MYCRMKKMKMFFLMSGIYAQFRDFHQKRPKYHLQR